MDREIVVAQCVSDAEEQKRMAAWLGPVNCAEFHGVRNDLLAALRPFGSVGPIGEFSLEEECEPLMDGEPGLGSVDCRDPMFFIVSDQYNDTYRVHRVETELRAITLELLRAVTTMLEQHEGWQIYFAVGTGALVLSGGTVAFDGPAFAACRDLRDIAMRCAPVH